MIRVIAGSSIMILREGIKRIFRDDMRIKVIGEVARAEDILLDCHGREDKILLLVDPLACDDQHDFYLRLHFERPDFQIIVVVGSDTAAEVLAAMRAGARGILSKGGPVSELGEAIRTVSDGKIYLGKEIALVISTELHPSQLIDNKPPLSVRELQVIKRIAIGRKNATIAEELDISVKTVSAHKSNILAKLALTSESNLVLYALENQLFDLFVDHSGRARAAGVGGPWQRGPRSRRR